jgi:hypothetical protein
VVLGQPVEFTELRRAVPAVVPQQACLFIASRALPPRQLLFRLLRGHFRLREGVQAGLGEGLLVLEVAVTRQLGSFEHVLQVLFLSEWRAGYW